ncbi:MAG: hypothetical protein MI749_22805 [Desulfovibrionales bacterium]|nr:hypothetical protein [Desulfovibrionales bacterium]
MLDIPNFLHFIHAEPEMTQEQAEFYVRWATHSSLYHVHIWVPNAMSTQCVPVLIEALMSAARVHPAHRDYINVQRGTRTIMIEPEVCPNPMRPLIIKDFRMLYNVLPERILSDEIGLWENYVGARRLIRLAILHKYGGITFEPVVEPAGPPLPLGVRPPREVLFHIVEDDPPYCTDNVIAAIPGSEKILKLMDMQRQLYEGEYAFQGRHLEPTARGGQLRAKFFGLKTRLNRLRLGGAGRANQEVRFTADEMYIERLQRAIGRSGVAVFNEWLAIFEGVEHRYKERLREFIEEEAARRTQWYAEDHVEPFRPVLYKRMEQGQTFFQIRGDPSPRLPWVEYTLYSFMHIFEYRLKIKEEPLQEQAAAEQDLDDTYNIV